MPETRDPILVLPATHEDVAELTELFDAYRIFYKYPTDLTGSKEYVTAEIEEGATRFFIARYANGGPALGFTHLIPSCNTTAFRLIWYLEDLFVHPSARRQGVGESLIREAERFARETGAERLTLATAHDNLAAQALYIKMGYVPEGAFFVLPPNAYARISPTARYA